MQVWASPLSSRLADTARPNRVRFTTDRSFVSCCFPPRLAATQLLLTTGTITYAWKGLAPFRPCTLTGALDAASCRVVMKRQDAASTIAATIVSRQLPGPSRCRLVTLTAYPPTSFGLRRGKLITGRFRLPSQGTSSMLDTILRPVRRMRRLLSLYFAPMPGVHQAIQRPCGR